MGGGVGRVEFNRTLQRFDGFGVSIQFNEVAAQLQPANRVFGILVKKFTGANNSVEEKVWVVMSQESKTTEPQVAPLTCGIFVAPTGRIIEGRVFAPLAVG